MPDLSTESDPDDVAGRYDGLLARNLRSQPHCRLFVGADLVRAHWPGVTEGFGALLAPHPDASILAVYDDSPFGRGRFGFVVTERHIHYVQRKTSGSIALDTVRRVSGISHGVRVTIGVGGQRTTHVDLRVDEWDARQAVQTWLEAIVAANRGGPVPSVPSATKALDLLEAMAARRTLKPAHIRRIAALAARVGPHHT